MELQQYQWLLQKILKDNRKCLLIRPRPSIMTVSFHIPQLSERIHNYHKLVLEVIGNPPLIRFQLFPSRCIPMQFVVLYPSSLRCLCGQTPTKGYTTYRPLQLQPLISLDKSCQLVCLASTHGALMMTNFLRKSTLQTNVLFCDRGSAM